MKYIKKIIMKYFFGLWDVDKNVYDDDGSSSSLTP